VHLSTGIHPGHVNKPVTLRDSREVVGLISQRRLWSGWETSMMTEAAAGRTGCEFGAPVWWMLLSGCFRRAQATSRADRETRCMDSKARKQECVRRALQPPTIMCVCVVVP
jgi:hypothetical protein